MRVTQLNASSYDLHISVNVLEHVPPDILASLLREAARVLKADGHAVHIVDPSDHFAHTDPTINLINFLRYSRDEWDRIAGNQFMYQNRLRASNYLESLRNAGFHVDTIETVKDQRALAELSAGFTVHPDFRAYKAEDLATTQIAFCAHTNAPINRLQQHP